MGKVLRTIAAGIGASLYLFVLGCGDPALSQSGAPSISQISPQTIAVGTQSQIIKVTGQHFSNQAAILWNGHPLPTTVVDSNTLSGAVEGSSLAAPATVQLQVQNLQNGEQSQPVPVTVAAPASSSSQLVISSATLPGGTANQPYAGALNATGGTSAYTWSITFGQLPPGLSLVAATGVISGTPSASGTFSFTATVVDSGNPKQTSSIATSITVAPSQLTITPSMLSSGTVGTAYSTPLQASGGTPAYTWSITGGSLPSGLILAATSGVISGTPTAAGTSQFTATVTDNSNPAQTQSTAISLTISSAPQPMGPGTTWYVRPDGGTRYSSNQPTGQCDGKGDNAYSGSGTNQHCAFNDVRMLWQDGTYTTGTTFPSWGWVIAGGDTVIIRGSLGTGVSYRVGWNGTSYDGWGIAGDSAGSGAPPPPSGTATQHTRILGENYASCHSALAKTQLHGGWGVYSVLNFYGVSYVDVACLDITDFSACGRAGQILGCDSTQDFAQVGIMLHNTSTNDTFTDIHLHGLAGSGILGATGDGVVMNYIDILGNASSGWNADASDGTTGVGSLNVSNFNISWNGCTEEYPIVDSVPYGDCTDDSSGGYGDGFGTATVASPSPGWQVHFDQGIVSYNTQDGLDALHISGPGSTMTDTRVLAFGNEGNQLKVGGATATIQNSVVVGNCAAMTTQAIPGTPAGFGSLLRDPCRAGNTAVIINITPGDPAIFQGNTVFTEGSIGLEVEYNTADIGSTNTLLYNDNIFVGFYNSGNQANPTPIYSSTDLNMLANPGSSWTNNSYLGFRTNWACPAAGESKALCTDPGLVDETYHPYGYGNMAPASSTSPVVGAGVAIPSIPFDYTGLTRPNPPSIGAYEFPQ